MSASRGSAWRRNTPKPRKALRLLIYLRDGFACVYCGQRGEVDGLAIDHIRPSDGNDPANLVACCFACNRLKQAADEDLAAFADMLRERCGRSVAVVLRHVGEQRGQPLTTHLREQARILQADPPAWLTEIRRKSDARERAIPF